MIPTTKWSTILKWSLNWPRIDPHFSSCRPRNDPQGIMEWWLNMGSWISFCSLLKCWNPVISFYSYEICNKRKVVVGSLFRYSLDPVSFQWTILVWCNVSNRLVFSSPSVLCFQKALFREMMISLLIHIQDYRRMQRWVSIYTETQPRSLHRASSCIAHMPYVTCVHKQCDYQFYL